MNTSLLNRNHTVEFSGSTAAPAVVPRALAPNANAPGHIERWVNATRNQWAARARPTAPGAGALPKPTASVRLRACLKKFTIATLLTGAVLTASAALKVGDTLPDLASFKLEGKLPDALKGKIVIVDFWASWCLPCAKSFPVLDELQKKYGDKLVVLGVNVDEKSANMEKFLAKHPVTFTVVRDGGQKLVAVVQPETMPTSFILDGDGKVRFLHNGFHGEDTRKEYLSEIESLLK